MYFAIHSPLVPVNPITHGKSLRAGYEYYVIVRLEEEHLLPDPYKTNCTDYIDAWKKNNMTGPRSQESKRIIPSTPGDIRKSQYMKREEFFHPQSDCSCISRLSQVKFQLLLLGG
ncbi:uncharacterized protein CEXT_561151 [Caerostris extrusa]|uniref:Uncharacterized protein n=1 Tax=Caerostris extrusa TaxID=172846 RepID=A0AAV4T391_CAEEX|nr:uncharacterized protein CEXT_561151 [Caerostris extrusa]